LSVGLHGGWASWAGSQQWFASCSALGLVKRAVVSLSGGSSSFMGPTCWSAFSSSPLDVLLLRQRIQLPGRIEAGARESVFLPFLRADADICWPGSSWRAVQSQSAADTLSPMMLLPTLK